MNINKVSLAGSDVRLWPLLLLLLKKIGNARPGRLTPYQFEDPSPTLPTYRGKEEKGKIVEDKNGESN